MTDKNRFLGLPAEGSGMTYHTPVREETGSCFRCGSPKGKPKTIWNDVYYVCRPCECEMEEIIEEVAHAYLCSESECFIGIRAKDIPELKRLFAQSENEDIRKLVGFLEDVEADIWPKEVKG